MFSRISSAIAFFFRAFTVSVAATTVTVTKTLPPAPTATPYLTPRAPATRAICSTAKLPIPQGLGALSMGSSFHLASLSPPIAAFIGATCTLIHILGIGSGGASIAQPVCFQDNNFSGIIALGFNPSLSVFRRRVQRPKHLLRSEGFS
ncbi:hypothetical protein FPV67DRAFT_1785408 [Lyophyllum atratum]|nr:hypothetical protein FPV67DRAFT_1785408 [Lyophyllum atratum]